MELVGGVEGHLGDLLIFGAISHHVATGKLHALEDGRLGRVTGALALQDRHSVLATLEFGARAEHLASGDGLPAERRLVELCTCMAGES